MGNQLDRITHLNYSELPTGDPSGLEKDELRVGVAYFFSDEEEEASAAAVAAAEEERTPSDCGFGKELMSPADVEEEEEEQETEPEEEEEVHGGGGFSPSEVEYSAFRAQECIFSKLRENQDLDVYAASTLLAVCKPGDLLELVAAAQAPHWAVCERHGRVIHLHKGEIRRDGLLEACNGRRGRVANGRYRYRALPADLVVQNAAGHVGLRGQEICWSDSESFAAWCRFGKREFKAGGEAHSAAHQHRHQHPEHQHQHQYVLKVRLAGRGVHTLGFRSLEDMIRERRRLDASGILRELSKD
ncbi:protein LRATD1 [Stigmatopora nigra]